MVRNLILQYISILPLPSDTCLLSLISVSAEDFPPLFSFHFSLYSSMPPFSLLSFSHRSLLAQLSSPFIFILKCECCQSVKRIYAFALPSFVIVWLCVYFSVRILSLFPSRARELYVCWEFKLLLYDTSKRHQPAAEWRVWMGENGKNVSCDGAFSRRKRMNLFVSNLRFYSSLLSLFSLFCFFSFASMEVNGVHVFNL